MEKRFYSSSSQINPILLLWGAADSQPIPHKYIGAGLNHLASNEEGKSAEWKKVLLSWSVRNTPDSIHHCQNNKVAGWNLFLLYTHKMSDFL